MRSQTQVDFQESNINLQEIGEKAHEAFRYLEALQALLRCQPLLSNLRLVADCINNITDMEVLAGLREDITEFYEGAKNSDKQLLQENAPAIYQTYNEVKDIQSHKDPISVSKNSGALAVGLSGLTTLVFKRIFKFAGMCFEKISNLVCSRGC